MFQLCRIHTSRLPRRSCCYTSQHDILCTPEPHQVPLGTFPLDMLHMIHHRRHQKSQQGTGHTPSYLCVGDFRLHIPPHTLHYHSHSKLYSQNKHHSSSPRTCPSYWNLLGTVHTTPPPTRRYHRGARPQHTEYNLQYRRLVQMSRVGTCYMFAYLAQVARTQRNMAYIHRPSLARKRSFPVGMRDTLCCWSCWLCRCPRHIPNTQSARQLGQAVVCSSRRMGGTHRCPVPVL
jgi:hypothetical protein